jgi:hypothetical protein
MVRKSLIVAGVSALALTFAACPAEQQPADTVPPPATAPGPLHH